MWTPHKNRKYHQVLRKGKQDLPRAWHHILSKVRKCLVVVLSILILIHLCFCSWVSVKWLVVFIPRHTKWPGITCDTLCLIWCVCVRPSICLSLDGFQMITWEWIKGFYSIFERLLSIIKYRSSSNFIIGSRVMVEKTENMRKHGRVLFHVQLDALFFFVQGPIRACGLVRVLLLVEG